MALCACGCAPGAVDASSPRVRAAFEVGSCCHGCGTALLAGCHLLGGGTTECVHLALPRLVLWLVLGVRLRHVDLANACLTLCAYPARPWMQRCSGAAVQRWIGDLVMQVTRVTLLFYSLVWGPRVHAGRNA